MPPEVPAAPRSPFDAHIDLDIVEQTGARVTATLRIDPEKHVQPYGIVHGGVYCAMAETVASYGAAHALATPGAGAVGQSNHTDFLRATRGGTLTATATPVHVGRSVQLWEVAITDDEDRLVAQSKVRLFNVGVDRMREG